MHREEVQKEVDDIDVEDMKKRETLSNPPKNLFYFSGSNIRKWPKRFCYNCSKQWLVHQDGLLWYHYWHM